jgi:hypothetical protein
MKPNQLIRYAICLALALASASVFAQVKINHGVDMTTSGLFSPNNFIYFGQYRHALELADGVKGAVTSREATATPILWRIMGEESDNKITLLSEYVIESMPYDNTGGSIATYGASTLHSWLNGTGATDFNNSSNFTSLEQAQIFSATVHTPIYNYSSGMSLYGTSNVSTKFYIPWGTPDQGTSPDKNRVFWTVGNSGTYTATDDIPSSIRGTGPKGKLSDPYFNFYYWLRPHIYNIVDEKLLVKSDENINIDGPGVSMGIRPMFMLDTAKIIFAAELMEYQSIHRFDQIVADNNGIYADEDGLPNGGNGGSKKAYKLTLHQTSLTFSGTLDYDLDEHASAITDTVAMKPGEVLGFKAPAAGGSPSPDNLAYKIVSDYDELMHYEESVRFDSLFVSAEGIYTPFVWSAGSQVANTNEYEYLNDNSLHTVYAWAQKINATQSNEGSTPIPFTLRVLDDNSAPVLSNAIAIRQSGGAADITFTISENNKAGKYYYLLNPATVPTSFDADYAPLISGGSITKTPFTLSSTSETVTFTTSVLPGSPTASTHEIYIIAKDLVRNVSNIIKVDVPVYVQPYNPVAKNPPVEAVLIVGETVNFKGDSLATDQNLPNDILTVTAITTPPNSSIATATIVSGELVIHGVTSGTTSVTVDVTDAYPGATISVSMNITVKEAPPSIAIDYVEEDLINFVDGGDYIINGGTPQTMSSILDIIPEDWFDTTISIVKVSAAGTAYNSPPQLLYIPPRPAPPTVIGVRESFTGYSDGELLGVNDSMQYRVVGDDDWLAPPRPGRTAVEYLAPGEYAIRYKAIANVQFASLPTTATIGYGTVVPTVTRAVYLPEIPGMEMIPAPGVYYVESSGTFTFTVKFSNAMLGVWTNRTVNGQREVLSGTKKDSNTYEYKIENITSGPVVIYIGGEYVANEAVPSTSVWSSNGAIHFDVVGSQTVSVYSLDGQLVNKVKIPEGKSSIPTPNGIYIVLAGERRYKVAVN